MNLSEQIRKIPPYIKLGSLGVLFSFVLGICFPSIKDWLTATEQPPTALRINKPQDGQQVQTDAFSVHLFQYYLSKVPEGNLTIMPDTASQCLTALKSKASPETTALFTPLQICERKTQSSAEITEAACLFTNAKDTIPQSAENSIVYPAPFSEDIVSALQTVNNTIYGVSNRSVSHMFSSTTAPHTTCILAATVIDFKPDWYYPIRAEQTKPNQFRNADGSRSEVPFMQANGRFRIADDPQGRWKAVAMFMRNTPQGDAAGHDSCALILIQPQTNGTPGARPLAAALTTTDYNSIRTALATAEEKPATINLPRIYNMETRLDMRLIPVLQDLGLGAITEPNAAPFPGLSATAPFPLSGFIQHSRVSFVESPASAVAPTEVTTVDSPIDFDRPFIWMLCPLTAPEPPYLMGVIEFM